mgnify:CR=1 FL=1
MKGEEVRIADFGICKNSNNKASRTKIIESPLYLPPEVLNQVETNFIEPSANQDIWALGVLAHELFSKGKHPFKIPNANWNKNVCIGIDPLIPKDSIVYKIIKGNNLTY